MPWGVAALAGASLVGGIYSANKQKSAAEDAANAQRDSAQLGIDESGRRFDAVQKLLSPYVNAGNGAIAGQQDLLGLNGAGAQQSSIDALKTSPQFQALTQQGEDAILANASATGGLRGGNAQAALAQFRPQLLAQLIDQQYQRLGGLTSVGQNAAAGTGNAGMQTGTQIANLLGQQGAASAGASLAAGKAYGQMANSAVSAFGTLMGGMGGGLTGSMGATPAMIGAGQF